MQPWMNRLSAYSRHYVHFRHTWNKSGLHPEKALAIFFYISMWKTLAFFCTFQRGKRLHSSLVSMDDATLRKVSPLLYNDTVRRSPLHFRTDWHQHHISKTKM